MLAAAFALLAVQGVPEARRLSASENAPVFQGTYRSSLRGRASALLPLLGDERSGFSLSFLPLIELHNTPKNASGVPFQFWRGRAAAEVAYAEEAFTVRLLIEHESDHETSGNGLFARGGGFRVTNFVSYNDVALSFASALALPFVELAFDLTGRLYFETCNADRFECKPFAGEGHVGFGWSADLTVAMEPLWWRLSPFLALHGDALVGNRGLRDEKRFVGHLGLQVDRLSIFLVVYVGNETGLRRDRILQQVGFGIRYGF